MVVVPKVLVLISCREEREILGVIVSVPLLSLSGVTIFVVVVVLRVPWMVV